VTRTWRQCWNGASAWTQSVYPADPVACASLALLEYQAIDCRAGRDLDTGILQDDSPLDGVQDLSIALDKLLPELT
jgi:hypothetical protein